VTVLVGEQRHDSVDMALRYLGMGAPTPVAADDQGRIRVDSLATAISESDGPLLLALQAGNLHSGAFDPIGDSVALARESGRPIWVHVDGAFGLFAAASTRLRALVPGLETADSWCTDAHKTLNVPYDCGIAIVRRPEAVRAAFSMHTAYLVVADEHGAADPLAMVPEMSRRARGVPVWAALKSLGREGVARQVEQMVANAKALASGIATVETAEVLNDVDFTQVSVAFGSDERTQDVTQRLLADGTAWMSGSRWNGRAVLRVSVSNWSTNDDDVARSVDAVRRAAASSQAV
jgi:glutamate/tyrosine decarboxylase-like PLP-dependent enzyme